MRCMSIKLTTNKRKISPFCLVFHSRYKELIAQLSEKAITHFFLAQFLKDITYYCASGLLSFSRRRSRTSPVQY